MTSPSTLPIDKDERGTRLYRGVLVGLCTLGVATAIGLVCVARELRPGALLGAACAAALSLWSVRSAHRALAMPRRDGPDPVLVAFVSGFLLKLAVLAGGTLALHFLGSTLFHPFAFAIAFAAGVLLFTLPATWCIVGGRAVRGGR